MKISWNIVLICLAVIILTACENEDYTFKNPHKDQTFNIKNTASLFENYIENGDKADFASYKREVIQPIYEDCFNDGEFIYMADEFLHTAPTNIPILKANISLLKAHQQELNGLIEEALLKSAKLLPSEKDVTVCLVPASNDSLRLVTVGAGKIIIPYNNAVDDAFLKASVAHEYHHSTWAEQNTLNDAVTLLDNLVFEGKAVMFAHLVYPTITTSYGSTTFNQHDWAQIEPYLHSEDFNRSLAIINGGNGLPPFYGYSEGFKMVQSYLSEYPETTPTSWTTLSATEIFEKGKYIEHYEEK